MPIDIRQSDPTRLSAMLELGAPLRPWEPGELTAVLRHQLSAPIDFNPPAADDAGGPPGQAPGGVPAGPSQQTFGGLLADPSPPIELLVGLKNFAKPFVVTSKGPLPREIAAVLYYGAIVCAGSRCGRRITELDDASLRYGLEEMIRSDWLDPATRQLMQEGLRWLAGPTTAANGAPGIPSA